MPGWNFITDLDFDLVDGDVEKANAEANLMMYPGPALELDFKIYGVQFPRAQVLKRTPGPHANITGGYRELLLSSSLYFSLLLVLIRLFLSLFFHFSPKYLCIEVPTHISSMGFAFWSRISLRIALVLFNVTSLSYGLRSSLHHNEEQRLLTCAGVKNLHLRPLKILLYDASIKLQSTDNRQTPNVLHTDGS